VRSPCNVSVQAPPSVPSVLVPPDAEMPRCGDQDEGNDGRRVDACDEGARQDNALGVTQRRPCVGCRDNGACVRVHLELLGHLQVLARGCWRLLRVLRSRVTRQKDSAYGRHKTGMREAMSAGGPQTSMSAA